MTMFWDEDIDFALRPKATQAKQGRRAIQDKIIFKQSSNDTEPPPQTRKTGGWADEALKGRKNSKGLNILEQQRFTEPIKENDVFSNIPVIPDVDDVIEATPEQTAVAPTVIVNRTETYTQISKDLMKNSLLATLGSTDFSILSEILSNEEQLKDFNSDEEWNYEAIFAELAEDYYKKTLK